MHGKALGEARELGARRQDSTSGEVLLAEARVEESDLVGRARVGALTLVARKEVVANESVLNVELEKRLKGGEAVDSVFARQRSLLKLLRRD